MLFMTYASSYTFLAIGIHAVGISHSGELDSLPTGIDYSKFLITWC